jgi:hypothetical protein
MSGGMQTDGGRHEGASQTLWYKSYPMILSNRTFQQMCCSFGFGLIFASVVEAQQGSSDNVSRVAGWQPRFRWIMKPGNDLHLVYTHSWLEDAVLDRFSSLDRRIASKVLYTHRF